jgi:hypothetical protein
MVLGVCDVIVLQVKFTQTLVREGLIVSQASAASQENRDFVVLGSDIGLAVQSCKLSIQQGFIVDNIGILLRKNCEKGTCAGGAGRTEKRGIPLSRSNLSLSE